MKQYGKVFSLRLGSYKAVVAASPESVKELLVTRSGDYAGRPPFHSFLATTLGRYQSGELSECEGTTQHRCMTSVDFKYILH